MGELAEVLENDEGKDSEVQVEEVNPEDFDNIFNMRGEFYLKSIQKTIEKEVKKDKV